MVRGEGEGGEELAMSFFKAPMTSSWSFLVTWVPCSSSSKPWEVRYAEVVVDVAVTFSGWASSFRCATSSSCFLISDGDM